MQYRLKQYMLNPIFLTRKAISKILILTITVLKNFLDLVEPSYILSKNGKKVLKRNKELHNKYKDKRCFILGTGPSLNKCDLEFLKDEVSIGLNSIWHHENIGSWEPTAICFVEPSAYSGSENWDKYFNKFREKIKKSILIAPLKGYKSVISNKLFPIERTYFISSGKDYSKLKHHSFDLTKPVSTMQTVVFAAIETAIYMGCNQIYLLGIDHDWATYRGQPPHFYNNKDVVVDEEVGDTSKYTYEFILSEGVKLWNSYKGLRKFAIKKGVEIYNASEGSFLDVFPFVKYNELFKKKDLKNDEYKY
jgi:hypothetical protein